MRFIRYFLVASLLLTGFLTRLSAQDTLTLALTGFSPHVGGLFEMRVVDWSDGKEVGRTRVESVAAADFSVSVPGISVGGSYNVDFYADLNGNGLYDSPGTDHAWRMTVENVLGDTTLTFAHSVTNFVDIGWNYLLTLDLTGFSPHVGGLFELRVVDWSDGKEVGRTRVESVATADFSVSLPGLAIGGSYNVDFYADLSGNGLYDSPGTDHAWRMTVANVLGDTTLTFAHSVTNFVDIGWNYLLTLDLTGFSPHVGGLFELRVVDRATSLEIGRSRVESIPLADFSVSVPGLMLQGSYDIDFYADLNGNGLYDDPPADHAWQMRLDDPMGDTTLTFAHSVTNFKDIAWPYLLSLDLTGFSPHVGGLFELRVTNLADGQEVGRTRVESVPLADFSVSLPVLAIGGNYNVDFYADLNGNGLYDSPGTDHAWRIVLTDVPGDTTLTFAHSVTNFVDIGWPYLLTLDLTGFSPHVGGLFELRVVDWSDGHEVGRTRVESIGGADFSASVQGLAVGGSYNVDFYADLNGNGLYDAPSTDHAWRMTVENVMGDTTLTFAHDVTNFVDIGWNYLLTLDLTGMVPHVGQLFALRVVDLADNSEAGRIRQESIPLADFSISVPGLALGGSYNIDFYADFNGNGRYDAPGTDHAWRMTVNNVLGDTTLSFAHNTSFTDIMWPSYVFTLALTGMTPHLGQLFELRVVDESYNSEVGRVRVSSIDTADFSVSVPDLEVGGSYNIDFYADFNGDGRYDAPGTDHAWRMTLDNASGDTTLAFAHNTTFTDIMWPPYVFTLILTGMTPHLGQLLELRLVDQSDSSEVGRVRVESVAADSFSVSVPGLAVGGAYNIDFYADFNGNGTYDTPGTDHAWRMTLVNALGDTTLAFTHNTTFTDIMWDYLTVNFTGMTPHLDQLFELRVVDLANSDEIGLVTLDSVKAADFSVSVPGLMLGGSYNIDFYADFNQNGQYDAPGTDHAWRLVYDYAGGYTAVDFSHNTTFTDIAWPYSPLDVPPSDNGLPDTYYLAQNYPNPFNPTSTIRFDLPHASAGSLIVYDLMGREVVRLMEGAIEAGYHTRVWDGRDSFGRAMPSGIFIARLVTPEYTKSIKMVLLK